MKAEKAAGTKREKLGQDNSSLSLFGEWQMVLHQIILLFFIVFMWLFCMMIQKYIYSKTKKKVVQKDVQHYSDNMSENDNLTK